MTVMDQRCAEFIPEMPEILGMLRIAANSNASAISMIQGFFGPDGSALQRQATGALVPETQDSASPSPAGPDIRDLRDVLSAVNMLCSEVDHLRAVCSELIMSGSDPFIEKPHRISDQLGERSPEATIKKYLLHSPKQLRDTKTVRTAITPGDGCSLARTTPLLPVLAGAVDGAAVTLEQAEVIAAALTPLARRKTGVDPETLATVEAFLVGQATGGRFGTPPDTVPVDDFVAGRYGIGMHPEELKRVAKQLAELVDQDGPEPADDEVQAKRGLVLKPGRRAGDPAKLTATLTSEAYEQLTVLLSSILDPKTGTSAETPSCDQPDEDPITFPQAQHDAFVTLLGLATRTAPDQGGAPPRVILLARAEQVLQHLSAAAFGVTKDEASENVTTAVGQAVTTLIRAGGTGFLTDRAIAALNSVIELANAGGFIGRSEDPPPPAFGASLFQDPRLSDSALLPATGETIPLSRLGSILCTAITEIVTTRAGDFLAYSVTERRTFTAAQRRVLLTTYASCAVPDCHVPGLRCDAHHVRSAASGGPTAIGNGILLCRHHHTKLHQGRLRLSPRQQGLPGFDAIG
jgi:hypothetical protein